MKESFLRLAQRLVIKIGSSLLTNEGRGLDRGAMQNWAAQIQALRRQGKSVVLVSSGAVAEGMQRLSMVERPKALHELQAAAAVGQMGLVQGWETCFREFGVATAQVLLTRADLAARDRYLNARSTLMTLLAWDVIPIINENDTVATEEIKVGDNDTLGALVAQLVEADGLVILTDQAGLYTADPRKVPEAVLIHEAQAGSVELEAMAGGAGSSLGRGGMLTKVLAAKRAARRGAHTAIVWGREPQVLERLALGESIGTQLMATLPALTARQQWLADAVMLRGTLVLDGGAVRALQDEGKSLLPVGVRQVRGEFQRGELVSCVNEAGGEVGRGLVNYSSTETVRLLGVASDRIEEILGYVDEPELIHRDNLVLL